MTVPLPFYISSFFLIFVLIFFIFSAPSGGIMSFKQDFIGH